LACAVFVILNTVADAFRRILVRTGRPIGAGGYKKIPSPPANPPPQAVVSTLFQLPMALRQPAVSREVDSPSLPA